MSSTTRACPSCRISLPDDAQFCLRCGVATPTDPGVPPRTATTGVLEVSQVRKALGDRYRIERVAGEGGMATVYVAEDLKHRRKVAVKVMRPELAATLGADRFLREIDIAAQLNHPHILPVHDSGAADGILYYVMPYVEGETLRELIARETQLPVADALRLAREIAEALAYAHQHGIIHRDIKPGNILINSGHALVADFGIARALDTEAAALTRTGLAVGTPQYMAPEQSSGDREVDGRADVYAVGAVLYEMLAGEPPFTGPTARAIVTRSMTEKPRPLTNSRAGLSQSVETVVGKALAKSPADRFATAGELAKSLDETLDTVRSGAFEGRASAPATNAASAMKAWTLFAISSLIGAAVVYALVQRYALPVWVTGLAAFLLLIGAAVMVMTGRMERRLAAGEPQPRWGQLFTWGNAATGGLIALGLWAVIATSLVLRAPAGSGAGGAIRLAVLPFTNRGTAEHDYFVDGVADEVRGKLTRVGGFEIIARSSSDLYRETTKSPGDIGSELGVDYLLSGTVTWVKTGTTDRVQVVPELIDVKTGASRWQQTFSSNETDILQLQSSIASEVARALGVALGGTEREQLANRPTENAAAYDLYLKARGLTNRDPNSARQAANFYEQAVALDQNFVEAWTGLATAQSIVYANGNRDPISGGRAREAADRANSLDPTGASAQVALLNYHRFVSHNYPRAREYARAALKAAPNDAEVLVAAAAVTSIQGYSDTALVMLDRARDLDPRSPQVAEAIQRILLFIRRYPEAVAAGETARDLSFNGLLSIQFQVMAYLAMGDTVAARRTITSAQSLVTAPALAAQFAGFYEISWALSKSDRDLLFRLTPAAFDNDRAWWGQSLATSHWDQGNRAAGRAYADSALAGSVEQVKANPDDAQLLVLHGLELAYLGRETEALAEAEKALRLGGPQVDPENGHYVVLQTIRINLALGRLDAALEYLPEFLASPGYVSPAWMRLDPMFRPLQGNPRFERLVAGS